MQVRLFLMTSEENLKGHPIKIEVSHRKKRKRKTVFYSKIEHWDQGKEMINRNHPEYSKGLAVLLNLKLRIKTYIYSPGDTHDEVMSFILNKKKEETQIKDTTEIDFVDFGETLINELRNLERFGNATAYNTAIKSLQSFHGPKILFKDFDYNFLNEFIQFHLAKKNSTTTISVYLRSLRTIYNEAVRRGKIIDKKPFKGLRYLTVKSNRNRKKHLSIESLKALTEINLKGRAKRSCDLFMLSFYLGGLDLIDIYFMEWSQISNNRLYVKRDKLEDGYEFDLRIFPEALKIIEEYAVDGQYVFPWTKTHSAYKSFYNNSYRELKSIQEKYKINVEPTAGYLGYKVARHTFATIALQKRVDSKIKALLMGHELNDIQSVYEYYDAQLRDEAHKTIIHLT